MLISLEDTLKAALLKMLQEYGKDAVEVTSFDDTTVSGGYCESCWYESAAVDIYYKDSTGRSTCYTYSGGFADLIRTLDYLSER